MTPLEGVFLITAYAVGCDVQKHSRTRAGTRPVAEFTIAADPKVLPIGTIVYIEGYGERMVHDTGGKVKGLHIDIFMDSCKVAKKIREQRRVEVLHVPGQRLTRAAEVTIAER